MMGVVLGSDAWDFADGAISEGTLINIPETMNAWIDPFGKARGTYLPWPPDRRSIVDAAGHESHAAFVPAEHAPLVSSAGEDDDIIESGHATTPSWGDGFDYVEGQA